jgi:hypothetical protein
MAYVPANVKELKDAVCWPDDLSPKQKGIILDHYIKHGRPESSDNGIDI